MVRRGWGYWTEAKLDILSAYLQAFTTASKSAGRTVYLDLFAGTGESVRRDTGKDLEGSARRALEVDPPLTDLYLFEPEPAAARLEEELREQFLNRQVEVVPGDCNQTIDGVLASIRAAGLAWAPTFAFIDPYSTTHLHWETLVTLADFKRGRTYKVELWMLFFGSALPRIAGLRDPVQDASITRLFGADEPGLLGPEPELAYVHEPPTPPFGGDGDAGPGDTTA